MRDSTTPLLPHPLTIQHQQLPDYSFFDVDQLLVYLGTRQEDQFCEAVLQFLTGMDDVDDFYELCEAFMKISPFLEQGLDVANNDKEQLHQFKSPPRSVDDEVKFIRHSKTLSFSSSNLSNCLFLIVLFTFCTRRSVIKLVQLIALSKSNSVC